MGLGYIFVIIFCLLFSYVSLYHQREDLTKERDEARQEWCLLFNQELGPNSDGTWIGGLSVQGEREQWVKYECDHHIDEFKLHHPLYGTD